MAVNTTVEVTMPQMGDSVSEGTILEWHKQEGDQVSQDETIVEISTDKVDAEVPAPTTGTVVKIHAAEGDTVTVGAVLAEIAVGDGPPRPGRQRQRSGDADGPPRSDAGGAVVEIEMPQMGESVSEGVVLEWHKQPGDAVAADETIVEISTDKVDAEVPAPRVGHDGRDPRRGRRDRDRRPGHRAHDVRQRRGRAGGEGAAADERARAPRATCPPLPEGTKATPVARRVAAAHGVDLGAVQGTGPAGQIGKDDVLAAAKNGTTASSNGKPEGATLLKGASAMLARYMDESRSIPTATSFRTITVTVLDGRRKQLKAAGQKVSFTHLIAYAIARAATEQMPVMARHFAEVDGKPHVVDDGGVNLGIAVDVEKKDGGRTLMVPVIRDAGRLSFGDFLAAFGDLIARARENKLTADDLQGANVSLTNPGGIGTIASVPRLMSGQGTIVATGSIAYPVGLGAIGATIGAEKVMTMTSTYDHRIIQGAESGQFLQVVEAYLQGEHGFYEQVFSDLGAPLGPRSLPPAAGRRRHRAGRARSATASRPGPRPPPASRAGRGAAAGRPGRDLADQGPPHARPPRRAARPARLRARGRSRRSTPSRSASRRSSCSRSRPRSCASASPARRWPTRCRTCARPTAARSPTRSSTSPRTASASGCARRSRPAPSAGR